MHFLQSAARCAGEYLFERITMFLKKIISILLTICMLFSCGIFCTAENSAYITEEAPTLSSNGVVYPNNDSLTMLNDSDDYAWLITKGGASASIFQYDLTAIPQNADIVKAEWQTLIGEKKSWNAVFKSFECEEEFTEGINYTKINELGYTHPQNEDEGFLTKEVALSDYASVSTSEYKGEAVGTVYSTGNLLTFDFTSEVKKFIAAGKKKFNFGVTQTTSSAKIRIPTEISPLPKLVITLKFDDSQSVDSITATRYNDYILNLHMTSPVQIASGIKGGEAGQAGQAIAISPSNPKNIAIGNDQAGIYTSTDGGKTFKSTSEGFMPIGVSDLMYYPENENIIIAMGTTNSPRNGKTTGIYKSTDGGKTWELKKQLPVAQRAGRYLQYGEKVNGVYTLYAATNSSGILSGVYSSNNMGETWQPLGLDTQIIYDLYADGAFLAASTADRGLFISSDGGKNWKRTALYSGISRDEIRSFVKDPQNENHMFAVDKTNLYESLNGGMSWEVINTAENIGVSQLKTLNMAKDPSNLKNYIVYLGTSIPGPSVRYSADNGRTFNKPVVHSELSFITDNLGYMAEPIEIDYATNTIFAFFDGDLHKSTDGGRSFYPSMGGYSGMRSRDYVFDKNDENYLGIAQTDRGFMQTVDGYKNSTYRPFDYGIVLSAGRYDGARTVWAAEKDPENSNHIIICMGGINTASSSALKRSTDNGKTWSVISESTAHKSWAGINRIYFSPENSGVIYAGYLKSEDGGETWQEMGRMVSAMSPTDGNVIYSISGSDNATVSISTNGGATWENVVSGVSSSMRGVVDSRDPYTLYMGTFTGGLLKIDAKNKTKTYINNGMVKSEGVLNIKDIAQDPTNPLHLIAGGANNYTYAKSGGLFESFDGGENWQVVSGIPASRDIWTVEFHPTLPKIYVGTSAGTFVYEWKNNPANKNK